MFNKIFYCPECNDKIKKNLSYDIQDEESCERGMGSETEYSIKAYGTCENCSYEYSISGSIYEYPQGVENYSELTID